MFDKYLPIVKGSAPRQRHGGCVVDVGQHHGGDLGHGVGSPMLFDDEEFQHVTTHANKDQDAFVEREYMGDPIYDEYSEDELIGYVAMEENEQQQHTTFIDSSFAASSSIEEFMNDENHDSVGQQADHDYLLQNLCENESHDCKENDDPWTETFTFDLDEKAEKKWTFLARFKHLAILEDNGPKYHISTRESKEAQEIIAWKWHAHTTPSEGSELRTTPFQEGEDDEDIPAKQVNHDLSCANHELGQEPINVNQESEHVTIGPSYEPAAQSRAPPTLIRGPTTHVCAKELQQELYTKRGASGPKR
ncbi:hypothetical protein EJB05_56568, partial [Eragrostis curvula]